MLAEVVSATPIEFGEELRRPVRLAVGVVYFVRVVEERPKRFYIAPGERLVEFAQVISERRSREMVDHVSLAARRGAFDHLSVPPLKDRVERPFARGRDPVQLAILSDFGGEIERLAAIRIGLERHERQSRFKPNLVERQFLQVRVGADGIFQIGDVDAMSFGPHERLLHVDDRRFKSLARLQRVDLIGEILTRLFRPDPRTAEGPASAGRHVDAHPQSLGLFQSMLQHLHPGRREEIDEAVFCASDAVYRRDLQTAQPRLSILLHLCRQIALVDRAAVPPPSCPWFGLLSDRRPGEKSGGVLAAGLCDEERKRRRQRDDQRQKARHQISSLSPRHKYHKILYRILRLLTRAVLYRSVTNSPRSDWMV